MQQNPHMRIAITGHRPSKLDGSYNTELSSLSPLMSSIKKAIEEVLLNENPDTLITGMALGVDTLFAKMAIDMNLPFIAAIPCTHQYSKWPSHSVKTYLDIIAHPLCIRHMVSDKPYNNSCMQDRNVWMVDNCDMLIAVWDGTPGGTYNCVKYAQSVNRKMIRINPNNYRV